MKTWPLPLKTPGTYLFRLVGIGNHRNWSDVETFAFLEFVGLVKSNPSLKLLVRYLFEAKFVRATRGLVEACGTLTEGFFAEAVRNKVINPVGEADRLDPVGDCGFEALRLGIEAKVREDFSLKAGRSHWGFVYRDATSITPLLHLHPQLLLLLHRTHPPPLKLRFIL